jgi:hypothetical protein
VEIDEIRPSPSRILRAPEEMQMAGRLALFAMLALVAGCGGASAGARTARRASGPGLTAPESFPTASAMAALPPPGPVQVDTGILVGHWEIEPASLAPAPGAAEPLYAELAAQRSTAQRSTGMECVAREIARFLAAEHGLPADSIRRFIVARCGGGAISAAFGVLPIQMSPRASEADVVRELHDVVLSHVVDATDPSANRVGLALYRDGTNLFVGVASTVAQLDLDPVVPIAAEGHLRFRATIARDPDRLIVMATSGERSVADCVVTGNAPALEIDCPFHDGDARAYVEILGRDGDAVLCNPLAISIGIASEGAGLAYDLRTPSVPVPMTTDLGAAVLPLLNGERAQLGAPALALSTEQSTANAQVAPYAFSTDQAAQEQAMLYVMAGWQLGTGPMIREGRTIQLDAGRTTDAGQWLFQALETPLERWVLLDPEARVLALGAVASDGATVGLASTYRFFDGDAASDRTRAEHALDEARRAAGRAPAGFVQLAPLDGAAIAISEQNANPSDALDEALSLVVRQYASARGHVYVASVLEHSPWAQDLLDAPHVGIAVRHARPAGSPWGVYVVIAVALP